MKFHTGSNLYSIGSFFFRLVCSVFMMLLGSCETKDVFLWLILTTQNNQSLLFIFPIIFKWKKKTTHMSKSAFEVYIIIIQICRNCMNFNLNNYNILTRYERKEQKIPRCWTMDSVTLFATLEIVSGEGDCWSTPIRKMYLISVVSLSCPLIINDDVLMMFIDAYNMKLSIEKNHPSFIILNIISKGRSLQILLFVFTF